MSLVARLNWTIPSLNAGIGIMIIMLAVTGWLLMRAFPQPPASP